MSQYIPGMTGTRAYSASIPWTDSEDRLLVGYAKLGQSAAVIAKSIPGKSRNSVIGRARRLKIKLSGSKGGAKTHKVHKEKAEGRRRRRTAAEQPSISGRSRSSSTRIPLSESQNNLIAFDSLFSGLDGFPVIDVREAQCRWPYDNRDKEGRTLCCGKVKENIKAAYCDAHAERALGSSIYGANKPKPPALTPKEQIPEIKKIKNSPLS